MHMKLWTSLMPICIRGRCQSPYAYGDWWRCCHPVPHMHISIDRILVCIWRSPYEYSNPHMHIGIQHPTRPRMQMGITICIRWSPSFRNESLFAHGDPRMHMTIPICIRRQNIPLFPICKWGSPYAYLNPRLQTRILHMQISIQEGGMMRGNVTASGHVTKGSGVRRADARQKWRDKWQQNNQPAHWWEVAAPQEATWGGVASARSDATTSRGEWEANGKQEAEAARWEVKAWWEQRNKRWLYNQPGQMRRRHKGECDAVATAMTETTPAWQGHWSQCHDKASGNGNGNGDGNGNGVTQPSYREVGVRFKRVGDIKVAKRSVKS